MILVLSISVQHRQCLNILVWWPYFFQIMNLRNKRTSCGCCQRRWAWPRPVNDCRAVTSSSSSDYSDVTQHLCTNIRDQCWPSDSARQLWIRALVYIVQINPSLINRPQHILIIMFNVHTISVWSVWRYRYDSNCITTYCLMSITNISKDARIYTHCSALYSLVPELWSPNLLNHLDISFLLLLWFLIQETDLERQ